MFGSGNDKKAYNTLRLSEKDKQRLLNQLESNSQRGGVKHGRSEERQTYGQSIEIVIEVIHPGGGAIRYQVKPRNLSFSGMGFLHGNFLHIGSQCRCVLKAPEGDELEVSATVMRCEYVEAGVHEVGVKFDSEITLDQFVPTSIGGE